MNASLKMMPRPRAATHCHSGRFCFSRVLHAGYRESAVSARAIRVPCNKSDDSYHAEDFNVASALIRPFTRTLEKTSIGSAVAGDRKSAGNHQIVAGKRKGQQPFSEITAGMIIGNVMTKRPSTRRATSIAALFNRTIQFACNRSDHHRQY